MPYFDLMPYFPCPTFSKIKVGHGLAASDSVEVNALIPGAGEPGSVASGGGAGFGDGGCGGSLVVVQVVLDVVDFLVVLVLV